MAAARVCGSHPQSNTDSRAAHTPVAARVALLAACASSGQNEALIHSADILGIVSALLSRGRIRKAEERSWTHAEGSATMGVLLGVWLLQGDKPLTGLVKLREGAFYFSLTELDQESTSTHLETRPFSDCRVSRGFPTAVSRARRITSRSF